MRTADRPPGTFEESERRGRDCDTQGTYGGCSSSVTGIRPIARSTGTLYGATRISWLGGRSSFQRKPGSTITTQFLDDERLSSEERAQIARHLNFLLGANAADPGEARQHFLPFVRQGPPFTLRPGVVSRSPPYMRDAI